MKQKVSEIFSFLIDRNAVHYCAKLPRHFCIFEAFKFNCMSVKEPPSSTASPTLVCV